MLYNLFNKGVVDLKNTQVKNIELPKIDITEDELNDIKIISPVEFLSEEENLKVIERIKDGLRNMNNPDRWLTREECLRLAKEDFNI